MKAHHVMKMVSMETPEDDRPDSLTKLFDRDKTRFPPELRLTFTDDTLEKLGIDRSCEYGSTIHLFALARVCAIHENGVCLQIESMAVEDEDTENDEADYDEQSDEKRLTRYNGGKKRYLDED